MPGPHVCSVPRLLRDRSGVALPLALLGLVLVTLMVTAALLTSTTEAALSNANLDATRALYAAEGAVQSYVAEQGAGLASVTNRRWQVPGTTDSALVNVVRIARIPGDATLNPPRGPTDRYAVWAQPLSRGRAGRGVVAMVTLPSAFTNMNLNVNAGATVGSDLNVGGNSKVVDRSTACTDTTGSAAVTHEAGTSVSTSGSGTISGAVVESQHSGAAFVSAILNGYTLRQYAELAEIKFGPLLKAGDFPTSARVRSDASNVKLRWGCPTGMGAGCKTQFPEDTLKFPSVAIDAKGGTVDVQGDYGQGILMVLNGNLRITGNFLYKGILIVEGFTEITGTGGQTSSKIEGALISLGEGTSQQSKIDESATQGNAVVSYNRCMVQTAQQAYVQQQMASPTFQQPSQPTFAWFEIVR